VLYLKQLSIAAGHELDLRNIDPGAWIEASRRAHGADYGPMTEAIRAALERGAAPQQPTHDERSVADRLGDDLRRAAEESAPPDETEPKEASDYLKNRGRSRDRGYDR